MKKGLFLIKALLLLVLASNAQIVYTDITDGVPAGIDFNQDGTNEFTISNGASYTGDYIEYSGGGATNNIHAIGTIAGGANWDVPSCVELNFAIGESGNWAGAGDCAVNGWGSGGNPTITADQDTYIACRISFGGTDLFYGWIRISVDASKTVTYKDYAYNATPNTPINAGDISGTVTLVTSITVQGQGGVSTITTQGGTLQMEAVVLPDGATNNSVTWSVADGTGSATISTDGLLTAASDGTVTVTASANDASGVSGNTIITISNQTTEIRQTNDDNISVYPNPSNGFVIIERSGKTEFQSATVYSLTGKTVFKSSLKNTINISNLTNGTYMLVIVSKNGDVFTKKIVKR